MQLIGLTGTGNTDAAARMAVEGGYLVCDFDQPIKHAAAEALGLPLDFFVDRDKRHVHLLGLDATPAQAEAKFLEAMSGAFGDDWRLNLWAAYVAPVLTVESRIACTVGDEAQAETVRKMGGRVVDAAEWREAMPH